MIISFELKITSVSCVRRLSEFVPGRGDFKFSRPPSPSFPDHKHADSQRNYDNFFDEDIKEF